jgi:hypothetical protein
MKPASLEDRCRAAMLAGDWPAVHRLATLMDLPRPGPILTLAGAALWYATQQLPVFPLQAGLKVPQRGTHGVLDASTDPAQIRRWWNRWPEANIGLACGHLVDVIDVDGPAGVKTWAWVLGEDPEAFEPVLGTVNTPRPGGSHIYRPVNADLGNSARSLPGIDYRGRGGYVVAPPSVDQHGHRYTWRRPLDLERLTGGPDRRFAAAGPHPATPGP